MRILFASLRTIQGQQDVGVYVQVIGESETVRLADGFDPGWSPDGDRFVFVGGKADGNPEIYVSGLEGSEPFNLTNHSANDMEPDWGRSASMRR